MREREASLSPSSPDGGPRKKMRKGTHSCFSCRRRKIRCTFAPDNPNTCRECFARGAKCIDQGHADADVKSLEQRKNLRERVAKLESLLETLVGDRDPNATTDINGAAETLATLRTGSKYPKEPAGLPNFRDAPGPVGLNGQQAPLLALLDRERPAGEESRQAAAEDERDHAARMPPAERNAISAKAARAREAVLAVLPPPQALKEFAATCEMWWQVLQTRATPAIFGVSPNTTFVEFADKASRSSSPTTIACLLLSLTINNHPNAHEFVDTVMHWVTGDDELCANLEGIECLMLIGRWHSNRGQPRLGWLSFRKALAVIQLLGLNHSHASSLRTDSIFWMVLGGDRMASMVLGVPHGITDHACHLNVEPDPKYGLGPIEMYRRKLAVIAGRVIDGNQQPADQTYASIMTTDQELDKISLSMPASYWEGEPADDGELYEHALFHMTFNMVRLYLHLPFMLKSPTHARYEYSKTLCFDAARQTLLVYERMFGTKSTTRSLFGDCKILDFVAFTAAVVYLFKLLGYGSKTPSEDKGTDEDWSIVYRTLDIFEAASRRKGGHAAAQCYNALRMLCLARGDCDCPADEADNIELVVPYFGLVRIGRSRFGKLVRLRSTTTPRNSASTTPSNIALPTPESLPCITPNTRLDGEAPVIEYNGFYMPNFTWEGEPVPTSSSNDFNGDMTSQWPTMASIDLDSDWSFAYDHMQNMPQPPQAV